jgi:hypothetical protein
MARRHIIFDVESKGLDPAKAYDRLHKGMLIGPSAETIEAYELETPATEPVIETRAADVLPDPVNENATGVPAVETISLTASKVAIVENQTTSLTATTSNKPGLVELAPEIAPVSKPEKKLKKKQIKADVPSAE